MNIAEAKAQLSYLIAQAKAGEEVIICTRNEPDAYLLPVVKHDTPPLRPIGLAKGEFTVPDSFFQTLSEEEIGMSFKDIF